MAKAYNHNWIKCDFCGKKFHGWDRFWGHQIRHPEYQEQQRLEKVKEAQKEIEGYRARIALREAYKVALAEVVLPPVVRDLVHKELSRYTLDFEFYLEKEQKRLELLLEAATDSS